MKTKSKYFFLFFIIFFGLLFIILPDIKENTACRKEKLALNLEMKNWVLVKVYSDPKNHNNETIEYLNNGIVRKSLIFNGEINLIFEQLEEGDTLFKVKNSLNMTVNKSSEHKVFVLDYGCERKD